MLKVISGALSLRNVCFVGAALLVALTISSSAALHAASQPSLSHKFPSRGTLGPPPPSFRRGVAIDMYVFPGTNAPEAASADVQYVLSLHANAVLLTFPFFMAGSRAQGVYAGSTTPSPGQVAQLAQDAERAGLYVSIRPLLDEKSIGMTRSDWLPADPPAWFASYKKFLLPYAEMAENEHIPELIVGAELDGFSASPRWQALDRALRRVYRGRLAYSETTMTATSQGGAVSQFLDAYPPFPQLPPSAGVAALIQAWESVDNRLPAGTVESEVGIAAVPGAYAQPWRVQWPDGTTIDPAIQARWFSAACRAALSTRLGGVYFWALGYGRSSGPSVGQSAAWSNSPGSSAIAACFQKIEGA